MGSLKTLVATLLGAAFIASAQASETGPAAAASTAPRYASSAEKELREALTAQLAPLLSYAIKSDQADQAKAALAFIRKGQLADAQQLESQVTDRVAAKLIQWKRLERNTESPAEAYTAFLRDNPNWPRRKRLQRLQERALLRDGAGARAIRRQFTDQAPVSGLGWAAWASAEQALGNSKKARALAAKAWCFGRFPERLETNFLSRFEKLLTEKDYRCRLDRLLISSPRSRAVRRSRVRAAERLLAKLGPAEQKKAKARIKAFSLRAALRELREIVKDPALVKDDWGLAFQRIARSRRLKNYDHAYKLLRAVPGDHPGHINRNAWWTERQRHARYWLNKGNVSRAYAIIEGVRPEDANPAKEQAFLAGWMALMQLGKPKAARAHFERMVAHADGPLSKSMSEYWLARAYLKLRQNEKAQRHFKESAKIRDTFHALLARQAISPKVRTIELPAAKPASSDELKRFLANDVVKGLLAGYQLGLRRRDILSFYRALGRSLESQGELALLAQLASQKGDGQGEVRTGKYGIARSFNLYEFAYPVHNLPDYKPLRQPIERAMLLAIARQESEFNTRIVSRAGARGVLQVMPITARHICRQYKINCKLRKLLDDPVYNTMIASAYVTDRRDQFGGSYILTLTGYNAGPGRTRQWLRQLGDPRRRNSDPLRWIYRIPFRETRLYVRKVLSNVQIYRARLGESKPLRLEKDLRRGGS